MAALAVTLPACMGATALAQTPSASPAPMASGVPSPAPSKAPAASPAPAGSAAPTPSPTPFKLITLTGSGDAGFQDVTGTDKARFVNGNPSRIFDAGTGPFIDENGGRQLAGPNDFNDVPDLQNANIQLTLNGSLFSAKFEGSFGSDSDVIASNGQSRSGANLTQAYLQITPGGNVTFIAGKFETLAGAEVIEAPGNTNFSRSYLFGEAIPFTHTGVRATWAIDSKVSVVAGANNGWDDWKFAGKKKTIEGGILLTPSPGWALTLDTYNGNDFYTTGCGGGCAGFVPALGQVLPVYTNRMLYDGVLTLHPTGALTLIANYDNGTQLTDGVGADPTGHWNGIAGYVDYQFTSKYGVSLRKETFHDVDGFRTGLINPATGLGPRLQSNTATFNYTPNGNWIFRGEYRLDAADGPFFTYRGLAPGLPGRDHQSSIGAEVVVKFP